MRTYIVILLQFIVWSSYTLIEWLSKHDHPIYNVMMFFVFFYLAFFIGTTITRSGRKTLLITTFSLTIYGTFHFAMVLVQH
jgi:hypothetical protein